MQGRSTCAQASLPFRVSHCIQVPTGPTLTNDAAESHLASLCSFQPPPLTDEDEGIRQRVRWPHKQHAKLQSHTKLTTTDNGLALLRPPKRRAIGDVAAAEYTYPCLLHYTLGLRFVVKACRGAKRPAVQFNPRRSPSSAKPAASSIELPHTRNQCKSGLLSLSLDIIHTTTLHAAAVDLSPAKFSFLKAIFLHSLLRSLPPGTRAAVDLFYASTSPLPSRPSPQPKQSGAGPPQDASRLRPCLGALCRRRAVRRCDCRRGELKLDLHLLHRCEQAYLHRKQSDHG